MKQKITILGLIITGFTLLVISALVAYLEWNPTDQEAASINNSKLWGASGELWDPKGRLPDFSYAGYHAGEKPIPNIPVKANVKNFGAKGDGVADDTQAFKNAIAQTNNGAILIPKGTYKLSSIIQITKSNLVLRGEGNTPNGTVLRFTKSVKDTMGESFPADTGIGGMVWMGKNRSNSYPVPVSNISNVTKSAKRGDFNLTLNNASTIKAGDYVVLKLDESADKSLGGQLIDFITTEHGNAPWQPLQFRWPVQVTKVSGNVITLKQPLRLDVELKWKPAIAQYQPVTEVGIENLYIELPNIPYPSHHNGRGYNGFHFQGTLNSWARNIYVMNGDNGVGMDGSVKHTTIQGLTLNRQGTKTAHHGVTFNANVADSLFENFDIKVLFIHDISVKHYTNGNVIRNGTGLDLNFDHHKNYPFENLFSNINVGKGSIGEGYKNRMWSSAGTGSAGPYSGVRETFWNIRSNNWSAPPPPSKVNDWQDGKVAFTPDTDFPMVNIIPARENKNPRHHWFEKIDNLQPADLYQSQLNRRLNNQTSTPIPVATATPKPANTTIPVATATIKPTNTITPTSRLPGSPTTIYQTAACGQADIKGDGQFGIDDFAEFARAYGNGKNTCATGTVNYGPCGGKDVNNDGKLNIFDFGSPVIGFAQRYGPHRTCNLP